MTDPSRLRKALQRWLGQMEPADPVYLAQYVEESTTNPGYHVVDVLRPDGTVGERREARGRCRAWAGVIVRLSVDRKKFGPDELVIIGADEGGYGTAAAPSMLEIHGPDHGFLQPDEIPNLHPLQIYPDRCQPKTGLEVRVLPGLYFADHSYQRLPAAMDVDLTASVPGVPGRRYVTLSLDAAENINTTDGTIKPAIDAGDIPLAPTGECPIAAVWLQFGDIEITRDRIEDLRYLAGGAASGGGSGSDLWENVIIVAKAGGDYTIIQDGEDAAAAGQLVLVMPGTYAENITVDVANLTLAGLIPSQWRGPWGVYLTGADDVGPILDLDSQCVIANTVVNRELTGGAGAYIGVDASAAANSHLIDCRIDIGGGATGRDVTAVKIAAAVGGEVAISRCFIRADNYGAGAAVELAGDTVIIEDCEITGDIVATAATTLYLRNCVVTGDVTGVAGSDLYMDAASYVSGTIGGWDSVTYRTTQVIPLADLADYTRGDIIRGGAADWESYPVGAANEVLTNDGTDILWSAGALDLTAGATLTVEAASAINQDLTTDASPEFNDVTIDGYSCAVRVDSVTRTVKAAGGDHTTIQDAIDWFKKKIITGACKIEVDAGSYDEAVVLTDLFLGAGGSLEIEGDTRALAAVTYSDGSICNRNGLANGGTFNAANRCQVNTNLAFDEITVTGGTVDPDFDAAGFVAGDTILVFDRSTGVMVEREIASIDPGGAGNNVIEITVALAAALGDDGDSICLLPDRRIERTTAGPCATVDFNKGPLLTGFFLKSHTGANCHGIYVINGGGILVENIATQVEDYGFYVEGGMGWIQVNSYTTVLSAWNGSRGYQASNSAFILAYWSYAISCGVVGYHTSQFAFMNAYESAAIDCGTYGFNSETGVTFAATNCTARFCGTGYRSVNHSIMIAGGTNANNNGNGANYSPAASGDPPSNNGSMIVWT